MPCTGRGGVGGDHCCWVAGRVCVFLVESQGGRRFACALRLELGSWDAVHNDPRYAPIQAQWDKVGITSCGDWQPSPGQCCEEEVTNACAFNTGSNFNNLSRRLDR